MIAPVGADQAIISESAQYVGDSRTAQPAMLPKLEPRQRTVTPYRFQDDADVSVGHFAGTQTDRLTAFDVREGNLCPPRPCPQIPHNRLPIIL